MLLGRVVTAVILSNGRLDASSRVMERWAVVIKLGTLSH